VAIPSGGAGLAVPDRPCECRSSDPAAPTSEPESRSSEDRSDHVCGDSVGLTLDAHPAITFARLILPTASPPKSPLYLRTSRLLI